MNIRDGEILLRSATAKVAGLLQAWWNDGAVMAHAGFPDGLGLSLGDAVNNILGHDGIRRALFIIEISGIPAGETNYRFIDESTAECGWKICAAEWQNRGYGTRVIRMLLRALFTDVRMPSGEPIQKAVWDTNLLNVRAQQVYERKIGA